MAMPDSAETNAPAAGSRGLLRSVGPAIIVASVVLGPGSIFTASKVGAQFGYTMAWVPVAAAILMLGAVATAARLGVVLRGTLCQELAARLGRSAAVFVGLVIFVIVATFQYSNNTAVIAACEPLLELAGLAQPREESVLKTTISIVALVLLNGLILLVLFGFRRLYPPLEKTMMALVLIMLVGFLGNLLLVQPSLEDIVAGLVPRWPSGDTAAWLSLLGLTGTTFSVAGAFYQSYLVREKGWDEHHLRQGLIDSTLGIAILGGITLVVMTTSAAVLLGGAKELNDAADVARQLEPLFGPAAVVLFSLGLFAAAFSSFLVNAMVGGTLLSDGLGLGARIDALWPKLLTALALLVGMGIAIRVTISDEPPVAMIILAQSLTVLGMPVLAFSLLYLATARDVRSRMPVWLIVLVALGCLASLALAAKTTVEIWGKVSG